MPINPHWLGDFSPLKISDCGLWVEADRGITLVGSKCSALADQSGNGRHFTQVTDANRFTYVSGGSSGINGRPALVGTGTQYMNLPTGLDVIRNIPGATIMAIHVCDTIPGNQQILTIRSSDLWAYLSAYGYYSNSGNGIGGQRLFTDTRANINQSAIAAFAPMLSTAIFDWSGAKAYLRVNGIERASNLTYQTPGNSDNQNATSVLLGAGATTQYRIMGRIALVVLWRRALSQFEYQRAERYYGAKYGITVA